MNTETLKRLQRALELTDELFPELRETRPETRDALALALARHFTNKRNPPSCGHELAAF